jgi:hypothetical protein
MASQRRPEKKIAKDGPPRQYQSVKAFQKKVDEYFQECDANIIIKKVVQKGEIVEVPMSEPYTMAGLAHHLDLSRQALNEYKMTDTFGDIVMRARKKIERANINAAALGLHEPKIAHLNLASNFGYSTKQELTGAAGGPVTIRVVYEGAADDDDDE